MSHPAERCSRKCAYCEDPIAPGRTCSHGAPMYCDEDCLDLHVRLKTAQRMQTASSSWLRRRSPEALEDKYHGDRPYHD